MSKPNKVIFIVKKISKYEIENKEKVIEKVKG